MFFENMVTFTSFTAAQTQIEQNCHLHAYTSVMVLACITWVPVELATLVSVPIPDTGISVYMMISEDLNLTWGRCSWPSHVLPPGATPPSQWGRAAWAAWRAGPPQGRPPDRKSHSAPRGWVCPSSAAWISTSPWAWSWWGGLPPSAAGPSG